MQRGIKKKKNLNFWPTAIWAPHHSRLFRAPSGEPTKYSTKENALSAPRSRSWLRRVAPELGTRDLCGCQIKVGAESTLGQWTPASGASAGPGAHAGCAWRQPNGMPHGLLCVTPAPRRKAQAAWRKSRSKPAGHLAFPRTPCWSRVLKDDQWQHGQNSELGTTLCQEELYRASTSLWKHFLSRTAPSHPQPRPILRRKNPSAPLPAPRPVPKSSVRTPDPNRARFGPQGMLGSVVRRPRQARRQRIRLEE